MDGICCTLMIKNEVITLRIVDLKNKITSTVDETSIEDVAGAEPRAAAVDNERPFDCRSGKGVVT